MSTTTFAPQLLAPAARGDDRRPTRSIVRSLRRASRTGIDTTASPASSDSVGTMSAFAATGPDARRSGRVLTTCATLAWLPVLVLTVLVFLLVGAVGGLAAAGVWTWRTVSPARTWSAGDTAEDPDGSALESSPQLPGAPSGRRVVRDRTIGYDA